MTEAARWTLLVYGVLMIVGGIMGYVIPKPPSMVSLIAGGASGLLAIAAFFIVGAERTAGLSIGLVVALGVGAMMYLRYQESKKFMPSGMVVIFSVVAALMVALALAFGSAGDGGREGQGPGGAAGPSGAPGDPKAPTQR